MGYAKAFPRDGIEVFTHERFTWCIRDRVDQDIEVSPVIVQMVEYVLDFRVVLDIARYRDFGITLRSEILDPLAQPFRLGGKRELCALTV